MAHNVAVCFLCGVAIENLQFTTELVLATMPGRYQLGKMNKVGSMYRHNK